MQEPGSQGQGISYHCKCCTCITGTSHMQEPGSQGQGISYHCKCCTCITGTSHMQEPGSQGQGISYHCKCCTCITVRACYRDILHVNCHLPYKSACVYFDSHGGRGCI